LAWKGRRAVGVDRSKPSRNRLGALAIQAAPWVALATMTALWPRRRRAGEAKAELSLETQAPPEVIDKAEPGRGRLAPTPHDIPLRGWKDILWRTWREVSQDRLSAVAGGVTFYALLAIFPAIGVFVSLYGLVADVSQVRGQLAQIADFLPSEVLSIVGAQMQHLAGGKPASLSAAFVISLLLSVWSANAGMKALFDGLNVAYDEVEKRNFFTRTLLTYGFTLATLLFLTLVTGMLVATPRLVEDVGGTLAVRIWLPLRWALLLMIAASAFSMAYRFGPCRAHARWRWVSAGGMMAAILWLGGSLGFSWYVNNVAHYDVTYGSLGAVIGFMMWIWFSVMVVLIGAEFNAEIEHQTALDSTTGPPLPMGERGAAMADTVGLAFHLNLAETLTRIRATGVRQIDRLRGRKPPPEIQPNSSSRADRRAA
jgi:membrane protein